MVQYIVQDPRLGKEPLVKHTTSGEMDEKKLAQLTKAFSGLESPRSQRQFLGWRAPAHKAFFLAGEPQFTNELWAGQPHYSFLVSLVLFLGWRAPVH